MRTLPFCFGAAVALAALCAPALADEELVPTQQMELSARLGALLPLSNSPANPASTVRLWGGYDAASAQSLLTLDAQALLTSWLQLQASSTYEDGEAHSRGMVQLGLLQDVEHGIDLQVAAGFAEQGVNEVPAVLGELSVGHEIGESYVTGGARFELGTEQDERGLVLDAAAMHTLSRSLYAGVDSELSLDLERDGDEPMDEATWALQAGPVVTYAANRFAATAGGGVSFLDRRMGGRESGLYGIVGLATAF